MGNNKAARRMVVYPGSFDPVTNGHIDIIKRAVDIFDSITIVVAFNRIKKTLFTLEERIEMLRELTKDDQNICIDSFSGLLVDYVAQKKASVILRGMRTLSDFEYEFQMSLMNRRLNRDIQTIFMMADSEWLFTSSTTIKEAAIFGGDIEGLVPDMVYSRLKEKFDFNAGLVQK